MRVRFEVVQLDSVPFGATPTVREVTPYSGKDLTITYEREDLPKYGFKKSLKDITFVKEDFSYFLSKEQSDEKCDRFQFNVISGCGFDEVENILFQGEFNMANGNWDLDRCTVKFKIEETNPYECFEENNDDVNVLDYHTPQTVSLGLKIETKRRFCGQPYENDCSEETLEQGNWTFNWQNRVNTFVGRFNPSAYLRYELTVPCGYNPTDEWILIQSCSEGVEKYAKKYQDIEPIGEFYATFGDGSFSWRHFDDNTDIDVNELDNGRKLFFLLDSMHLDICRGDNYINIVSDFFQYNPENETSINYVTQETNLYSNLIIFQKSDVKRPNASGNAIRGESNFIELLETICEMFNCGYTIKDGVLRIEHISYFQSNLGLDLLTPDNLRDHLSGTRKYNYDDTELPRYERFKFMDSGSADFVGLDIIYDSNCTNNKEENRKEVNISEITTDVLLCLENPSSESEVVSDDGFVIIACDENNNAISLDGILENGQKVNNVLGWAYLHEKLFKHQRVLKNGNMNGSDVEFESVNPTIKQDKFSVVMKCDDIKNFEPLDQIKATLGWGHLQGAELNLFSCSMRFDLMLENIQGINDEFEYGDFDSNFDADFD